MRAEAIFALFIEVVGGGAPQESVISTLRCTAVVLGPHEQEGEFAELSISIAKLHFHHCQNKNCLVDDALTLDAYLHNINYLQSDKWMSVS